MHHPYNKEIKAASILWYTFQYVLLETNYKETSEMRYSKRKKETEEKKKEEVERKKVKKGGRGRGKEQQR